MGRKEKAVFVGESCTPTIGEQLRLFRQEKGLSLAAIADILIYSKSYLSSVENGRFPPSPELLRNYRQRLNFEPSSWPGKYSTKVPYLRNPFFTGRDNALSRLLAEFAAKRVPAICALVGSASIGKTQVAVEYLYRYRYQRNYQAILWLRGDSFEALKSDLTTMAALLSGSKVDDLDQERAIKSTIKWLKEDIRHLIVIDGLDAPEEAKLVLNFISQLSGHIILTSRIFPFSPEIPSIQLGKMTETESVLFLLRRAGVISFNAPLDDASEEDVASAKEIAKVLDGLPESLDRAGALIKETECGFSGYLQVCNAG